MHRVGSCLAICLLAASLSRVASAQAGSTDSHAADSTRPGSAAPGQPSAEPAIRIESLPSTPEERIQDLERRLRLVEGKHAEAREAAPTAKSPERGAALAGPEGVVVTSADGKLQLRFRPLVQADAHVFVGDGTNTFLVRRARPAIEGTAFEYFDWALVPDLANGPILLDAFVNIRLFREIQLRGGKFKPPVGLERLMAASDLPFVERGLPNNLVPARDIGVALHGDILGGTLVYSGGLFNGAADGTFGDIIDNNDKKDLVGRIMVRPFQPTFVTALRKLGLGIAATRGTHAGFLPPYRTPVQTPFFQYVDGVMAGGTERRIAPQASFYLGPVGLFAEYTRSTLIVVSPGQGARLNHDAWQVVASVFVTGEEASPTTVTPKHALNPRIFGVGAVELVARYGELSIDEDAFRFGFADPNRSARKATDWGIGVNWHMARNFKWMVDFEHTSFAGGSPSGDRRAEILGVFRLQAAY